jgi:4-amino-4-deoxy-L-arabinose transferase-like glycosyltransferase
MAQTTIAREATSSINANVCLFATVFLGALAITLSLRGPGFIHHDTSEVVMWGHSGWAAGFWKHPPFLPWLARAWFSVLPMSAFSLAVLTAANITVCAWAVWSIARMSGDTESSTRGLIALGLLMLVPFASLMSIKLNHNSILISLWPLTTLAFLRALDKPTVARGALFGLLAAAAVLAKYYSLLLLAGCIAASFASQARAWRFYRGPAPYVAVAAFALAMIPHVLWMLERSAPPLTYALKVGVANPVAATRGPATVLDFAVQAPLLLLPLAIAAWLLMRYDQGATRRESSKLTQHPYERELILLAAVPYVLTIILVYIFHLRGAVAWAMPLFVCLPAIVAARISTLPDWLSRHGLAATTIVVMTVIAGGLIGTRIAVARGADGVSEPRREIAEAVTALWHSSQSGPLPIVAGDQRLTSAAMIFSADHPQGWPSFSATQAPWIDAAAATKSGFAGLCRPADGSCIELASQASGGRGLRCTIKRRVEHLGAVGPWFEVIVFLVPPAASTAAALSCPPVEPL